MQNQAEATKQELLLMQRPKHIGHRLDQKWGSLDYKVNLQTTKRNRSYLGGKKKKEAS